MEPARFLNQQSYAIAAALLLAWAGYRVIRGGPTLRSILLLALLAVGLAAPPLWLRSVQHELAYFEIALASGRPTLLEVYSDL